MRRPLLFRAVLVVVLGLFAVVTPDNARAASTRSLCVIDPESGGMGVGPGGCSDDDNYHCQTVCGKLYVAILCTDTYDACSSDPY
jgi:hypothetical protein